MNEEGKAPHIEVQDIDHLGIVAGIIDEIGLVEEVDHKLGTHSQQCISSGQVLKAMIVNGLGFVSAPMYLFEEFFIGKATDHLIGEAIEPSHLNDDRLGRVLDKLYEADLSELFVSLAARAAHRYGVSTDSVALDSSSFHLHGEYESSEKEAEPEAIRIRRGYSRDHRPDLKQFVVDLMSTADGGVPVFLRVADGNEADQAVFAELLRDFRAQLDFDALFVADAALYGAENLASMGSLRWLCRVPATLTEARQALRSTPREDFIESTDHEGYRFAEVESDYGGVAQRWLVVHSEELERRAAERLQKSLDQREKELNRELRRLCRQEFACREDAAEAAEAFACRLDDHHRLTEPHIEEIAHYTRRGRPAKGTEPEEFRYRIQTALQRDEAAIASELEHSGRYLLATNVTDPEELSGEQMLSEYKSRQSVERGFRFLKDPLFFTQSTFVNTPRRVAAIAMVMGLCLLVYAVGERSLRTALAEAGSSIRHQTGKPTQRPTLRWVFQMFQAVHVLDIDGDRQVSNLTAERRSILGFLGHSCQRYYLLC